MTKKGGNVILRRRARKPDHVPHPSVKRSRPPERTPPPPPAQAPPQAAIPVKPLPPKRKRKVRPRHKDKHPILILAAGTEVAWEKKIGTAKQLLPMDGDTVLGRIIRQVRERGVEPILVTHREDFVNTAKDVVHYEPASRNTIADTILNTQDLWAGQTVILLGDTVFGNATLNMILAHRGPFTAFGNSSEIFAFSFNDDSHEHFISTLEKTIADPHCWKASPWQIYRIYCGKRPDQSYIDKYTFEFARDATGDIDSLQEYNAMRKIAGGL